MTLTPVWELRARFAAALSQMYGREVPAYRTLVEVTEEVNRDVLAGSTDAERLGSIGRVSAERHGAIRVGTPTEMRSVARLFAAFGMFPVGFYDLRDAASPVPVISTAFRPVEPGELARNPFRVFTSMLVSDDRRFFDPDLTTCIDSSLARRTLFDPELLELADVAAAQGGLDDPDTFVSRAAAAFELGADPIDRSWYDTLEAVSAVAADIVGASSTHINHLTPRVLDIDELYSRMQARGIEMIDRIQGPPRLNGPDVLLRQTSFRALSEARTFFGPDGTTYTDTLRVRFGEVESRGIALTPAGRTRFDAAMADSNWNGRFPNTETELAAQELAYFTFEPAADAPSGAPPDDVASLVRGGWVTVTPIVYEDFLPASAAGIFRSNLTSDAAVDTAARGTHWSADKLAAVLGVPVSDPFDLYDRQSAASLQRAQADLRAFADGAHS